MQCAAFIHAIPAEIVTVPMENIHALLLCGVHKHLCLLSEQLRGQSGVGNNLLGARFPRAICQDFHPQVVIFYHKAFHENAKKTKKKNPHPLQTSCTTKTVSEV